MKPIAARIAAARKLPSSDYRDVIRELKKEQLGADEIMPHYQKRLAEIEDIVRDEQAGDAARRGPPSSGSRRRPKPRSSPRPHMLPPPLLNNHGERGQFVLPLGTSGAGGEALKYDDFTFAAASWTLIAHEARPGHELQFDSMVERGVSLARALYAFNSTNVEGWGLYSEWFMLPYMPDEGKLISLQLRLLRAARAFLDPELQEGKDHAGRGDASAARGRGLSRKLSRRKKWIASRSAARPGGFVLRRLSRGCWKSGRRPRRRMGAKFNVQRFHDFILSQGLLPPDAAAQSRDGRFRGRAK